MACCSIWFSMVKSELVSLVQILGILGKFDVIAVNYRLVRLLALRLFPYFAVYMIPCTCCRLLYAVMSRIGTIGPNRNLLL